MDSIDQDQTAHSVQSDLDLWHPQKPMFSPIAPKGLNVSKLMIFIFFKKGGKSCGKMRKCWFFYNVLKSPVF